MLNRLASPTLQVCIVKKWAASLRLKKIIEEMKQDIVELPNGTVVDEWKFLEVHKAMSKLLLSNFQ